MKWFVTAMAVGLASSVVMAEDKAAAPAAPDTPPTPAAEVQKPKAAEPVAQALELTGKIVKKEKQNKLGKTVTYYDLVLADGTVVYLPTVHPPKAGAAPAVQAANPADFVDQNVKIKGQGTETEKKGKKRIRVTKIESIEKV